MSLDTRTKKVTMIVNIPKNYNYDSTKKCIDEFINKYASNWFYIYHDKDIDENGVLKTPHFHLCFLSCDDKMHRLLWYISRLGEFFGDIPYNFITVDVMKSYEGSIQYLIHKNDPNKYQYTKSDVICFDDEELENVLKVCVTPTITIDRIKDVCKQANCLTECYMILGLGFSQLYRNLIKDIFNDYQKGYLK